MTTQSKTLPYDLEAMENWNWDVSTYNLSPEDDSYFARLIYYSKGLNHALGKVKLEREFGKDALEALSETQIDRIMAYRKLQKKLEQAGLDTGGTMQYLAERYSVWKWESKSQEEKQRYFDERLLDQVYQKYRTSFDSSTFEKLAASLYQARYLLSDNDPNKELIQLVADSSCPIAVMEVVYPYYVDGEVSNGGWSQCILNGGLAVSLLAGKIMRQNGWDKQAQITESVTTYVTELSDEEWKKFGEEGVFRDDEGYRNSVAERLDTLGYTAMSLPDEISWYKIQPSLLDQILDKVAQNRDSLRDYLAAPSKIAN